MEEIEEWNDYIQLILFAYHIKELRIIKTSSYWLVYRKDFILAEDKPKKVQSLIKQLRKITLGVLTLRKKA